MGHPTLAGLASQGRRRDVQHQKEQTEVPEDLPAPLVVEALGWVWQRKQLLTAARASEGKAAVRSCGDWSMSPKNTWCVLRRGKQTAS